MTKITISFLMLILTGCRGQPPTPKSVAELQLKGLARNSQWRMLGVSSSDEATHATLGSPIPVYLGRADELSQYTGGDLKQILHSTETVVFPVLINGHGRMLIEVGTRDGEWVPLRDGYQDSAFALVEATQKNPQSTPGFVKVGSLNESSYLMEGTAESQGTSAPGGASESTKFVDMRADPILIPLNAAAQSFASQVADKPSLPQPISIPPDVLGSVSAYSSPNALQTPVPVPNDFPNLGPEDFQTIKAGSAATFFKKIAPIAKEAAAKQSNGPSD